MRFVIQIGASLILTIIFICFFWFAKVAKWSLWLTGGGLVLLFILGTGFMTVLSLALQPKKKEDKDKDEED